jgi:hypothetical protein
MRGCLEQLQEKQAGLEPTGEKRLRDLDMKMKNNLIRQV